MLYLFLPCMLYLLLPSGLVLLSSTLVGYMRYMLTLLVLASPVSFSFSVSFAEVAALALSFPMVFAVLNPSGIVRGLATASLGFAFASVGINVITGEVRYVFGQPDLWTGLPLGPVFAGLLLGPIGATLALAGYRGRWGPSVRVTAVRRGFLLVAGSALMVWAVAEIFFYEDTPLAIPVGLAFTGAGFLMQRCQWPRLPLLLGIILGSGGEANIFSAAGIYGLPGALVRPFFIVLAFMVLALAVLSYRLRRSGTRSGDVETTEFRLPVSEALLQRRNIVPVLGVVAGAAFWWGSLGFEHIETWFMPRVAGLAAMVFCLLELTLSVRNQVPQSNAWPVGDATETKPRSP